MDCAPFIRSKRVLAAWVATPLLLLVTLHMAVTWLYRHQRISFEQKQALTEVIPEMQREAKDTKQFLQSFRAVDDGFGSVQDFYIGMLNRTAEETGFKIETIYIDQQDLNRELGTKKLTVSLQGTGTLRQITRFLKTIKENDPMICENNLQIMPSAQGADILMVETKLIKVYAE